MKIILIGGNGFIGRNIERYLANQYDVIVYDRIVEKIDNNHIEGTIEELEKLAAIIEYNDIIIHLAANTVPASSGKDLIREAESSIISNIKLFLLCAEKQVGKIIFSSSGGAIYGFTDSDKISEEQTPRPISTYGINKLAVENYLRYVGDTHNIPTISLRISNPYGYGQKPFTGQGVIATYLAGVILGKELEVWGDGKNVKDYIYIEDVADAFEKAVRYAGKERVFNIGTGCGTSINNIIQTIKEEIPDKNVNVKYINENRVDVKNNVLNCSKANCELNWRASTTLKHGIKKMIHYWEPEKSAFTKLEIK